MSEPARIPEKELTGLRIHPADPVDFRRDLFLFLRYVRERGLRRTVRDNAIPLADVRRLSKILSWHGGKDDARWIDHVSWIAREMGLVRFDAEGIYRGYSSTSPSYPDNDIEIEENAVKSYLARPATGKEAAILEAHLSLVESEFFEPALLLPTEVFDRFGSATGPAGAMDLARVRRGLLEFLAELELGVFYDLGSVVEALARRHPRLILASSDGSDSWDRGDLHRNFREYPAGRSRFRTSGEQITSKSRRAFARVEGRYFEFFLRGIPYLLGFVELAERPPEDRHGLDVTPPLERIRAFRVGERLRQVLRRDPAFDRTRVIALPTSEILVEAPSYPETTLAALEPFAKILDDKGPVHRLKLVRERVVKAVADSPDSPDPASVIAALTGSPLPGNLAAELGAWARRGGSATLYEGFGILEIAGDAGDRKAALAALGGLVFEESAGGLTLVEEPKKAFERLETARRVPVAVRHSARRFAAAAGPLAAAAGAPGPRTPAPEAALPVRLVTEDLVGLSSDRPEFLAALAAEIGDEARSGPEGQLLLPATALAKLRAALRRLGRRFRVEE